MWPSLFLVAQEHLYAFADGRWKLSSLECLSTVEHALLNRYDLSLQGQAFRLHTIVALQGSLPPSTG